MNLSSILNPTANSDVETARFLAALSERRNRADRANRAHHFSPYSTVDRADQARHFSPNSTNNCKRYPSGKPAHPTISCPILPPAVLKDELRERIKSCSCLLEEDKEIVYSIFFENASRFYTIQVLADFLFEQKVSSKFTNLEYLQLPTQPMDAQKAFGEATSAWRNQLTFCIQQVAQSVIDKQKALYVLKSEELQNKCIELKVDVDEFYKKTVSDLIAKITYEVNEVGLSEPSSGIGQTLDVAREQKSFWETHGWRIEMIHPQISGFKFRAGAQTQENLFLVDCRGISRISLSNPSHKAFIPFETRGKDLRISASEKLLALSSGDNCFTFNIGSNSIQQMEKFGLLDPITSLMVSGSSAVLYGTNKGEMGLKELGHKAATKMVGRHTITAIDQTGSTALFGSSDKKIHAVDIGPSGFSTVVDYCGHLKTVSALAVSSTSDKQFISAGKDGFVYLWDINADSNKKKPSITVLKRPTEEEWTTAQWQNNYCLLGGAKSVVVVDIRRAGQVVKEYSNSEFGFSYGERIVDLYMNSNLSFPAYALGYRNVGREMERCTLNRITVL